MVFHIPIINMATKRCTSDIPENDTAQHMHRYIQKTGTYVAYIYIHAYVLYLTIPDAAVFQGFAASRCQEFLASGFGLQREEE